MIDLADLSSAVQLACGLNLAVGVLSNHHHSFISSHQEYLDYIRNVVKPRMTREDDLEQLDNKLAYAESAVLQAKFTEQSRIERMRWLCLAAGTACIPLLILPAFHKPTLLDTATAVLSLAAMFVPVPLALLALEERKRRWKKLIEFEKADLQRFIEVKLNRDD